MKIFRFIKFFLFGRKAKSKNSKGRFYKGKYMVFSGKVAAGEMIYFT